MADEVLAAGRLGCFRPFFGCEAPKLTGISRPSPLFLRLPSAASGLVIPCFARPKPAGGRRVGSQLQLGKISSLNCLWSILSLLVCDALLSALRRQEHCSAVQAST